MPTRWPVVPLLIAAAAAVGTAQQAPTAAKRTWKDAPDPATVVAATFLGGKGHEWLAGGGFAPDGTIVVAGNVMGPALELPVGVIGSDLPAPPEPEPLVVKDRTGKPKLGADGKPVPAEPSWRHPGVTGFVARLSPDMGRVLSAHRLPWTAGVITAAAVGPDGSVYIAGRATDGVVRIGGDVAELPSAPEEVDNKGRPKPARCNHAFAARLTADGSKAVWVRHVRGPSAAPTVGLSADGRVRFGAGRLFVLSADGKTEAVVAVPGGLKPTAWVNPADGSIAVGGEHHSATGREPWRCPTLNIHKPDGTLRYQFYDWGGPFVGLDNLRQVSDSAVRLVTHDPDGGILLQAWSDGGNSVMTTQPFDVRAGAGHKGLGLNAAGAGVLSCAYLISLDPKTYRIRSWTFWSGLSERGKPNSIWLDAMTRSPDHSLCIAGKGAWGIWQTRNRLTEAAPWGGYVAVFGEDFGRLRFSSVIPGAGAAEINDGAAQRGGGWGVAVGTVDGRTRVLYLSGTTDGREEDGKPVATPVRNPAQAKYGGGWCDGYALLLELPPPAAKPPAEPAATEADRPGPTRCSFERGAKGRDPKKGAAAPPADGTVFHFTPAYPKHVTVDAEIRDHAGRFWPSFLFGKPVEGTFTWRAGAPEARLKVACTSWCQPHGDQDRRILGELIADPKAPPPLTLTIESLGPAKTVEHKVVGKGRESLRTVEYHDARAVLEVAGRTLNVSPKVTIGWSAPKDGPVSGVKLSVYVTLNGSELGLKAPGADGPVDIRIGLAGSLRSEAPPKGKK